MRLFRSGIYEYDKRKPKKIKACQGCGTDITGQGGKLFCLPCYATRYEENVARNRLKYKARRAAARCCASKSMGR